MSVSADQRDMPMAADFPGEDIYVPLPAHWSAHDVSQ
jgi:hypothetical protein